MATLSVPLKSVVAWYCDATTGYTPPTGWSICDGSTLSSANQDVVPGVSWTLPDLRNRFILGASLSKGDGVAGVAVNTADINSAAGAPGPKGTGGENQHTLTAGEIPLKTGSGSAGAADSVNKDPVVAPHENRPRYYGMVYIMKVKY